MHVWFIQANVIAYCLSLVFCGVTGNPQISYLSPPEPLPVSEPFPTDQFFFFHNAASLSFLTTLGPDDLPPSIQKTTLTECVSDVLSVDDQPHQKRFSKLEQHAPPFGTCPSTQAPVPLLHPCRLGCEILRILNKKMEISTAY